jgi:hypothetical protein
MFIFIMNFVYIFRDNLGDYLVLRLCNFWLNFIYMLVLKLGLGLRVDHTSQHLVKVTYQGPKKVFWPTLWFTRWHQFQAMAYLALLPH